MKAGWRDAPLGQLVEFQRGLTYAKTDEVASSNNVVLRATNIDLKTNALDLSELRYINAKVTVAPSKVVKRGSLLICTASGSKSHLGKVALIDDDYGFAFGGFMGMLTPRDTVLPKYLLYAMTSQRYKDFIDRLADGANINNLKFDDLSAFTVPVPPLAEQKHLVAILDQAFEALDTAKANAEKNRLNAEQVFASYLWSVFSQDDAQQSDTSGGTNEPVLLKGKTTPSGYVAAELEQLNAGNITRTGGRDASKRHIPGTLSLAVGRPETGAKSDWRWSRLSDLARLESGHTPSRKHPEYWGGTVPWIGIQDARENHGKRITQTREYTNELGVANSSARVLPKNTVCLSRTASVGYVVVMGRPMATSQDFVNWICSESLVPDFLKYLFLAEGRNGLLRYASGSVHQTIYFPEAKAFWICHPNADQQMHITALSDELRDESKKLEEIYEHKVAELGQMREALLSHAFIGDL